MYFISLTYLRGHKTLALISWEGCVTERLYETPLWRHALTRVGCDTLCLKPPLTESISALNPLRDVTKFIWNTTPVLGHKLVFQYESCLRIL